MDTDKFTCVNKPSNRLKPVICLHAFDSSRNAVEKRCSKAPLVAKFTSYGIKQNERITRMNNRVGYLFKYFLFKQFLTLLSTVVTIEIISK